MKWVTRLHRTSTSRDQSEIRHRNKKLLYRLLAKQLAIQMSRARRKKDLINEEKFIHHVEIITCNIRFSDFFKEDIIKD